MEKERIHSFEQLAGRVFKVEPLNDKRREAFYNEFSSLLTSGIDMRRTIQLIIDEQEHAGTKAIIDELKNKLVLGASLSEAMALSGNFSPYEYHSVRIGEETGRLSVVLDALSVYFGDKVRLKRQLVGVFTYPLFVLAITIGVLYFMLTSVVPMFEDVFKQFGQELPWLTLRIIWLSDNFSTGLFILFLLIGSVAAYLYSQREQEWYKQGSGEFMIRIPVFGPLIRKIYLARLCQSLGLLISSKTPLVKALDLSQEMIKFHPLRVALISAQKDLLSGSSLHEGLSKFDIFDKRFISLIKIAEEINQLDTTFDRLSKQYKEDIEYRTKLIGTIIEPAIIVIIGLIVGLIMVAMYLPMFNLSNVIK